jgi:hypothetical protein
MSKRLFSEAEDAVLAVEYLAGKSSTVLARERGCDKAAVLGALRRRGVVLRDSGKARRLELEARRDEIVTLYRSGLSVWAIKTALGCQHTNPIVRILRENGIEPERRLMVRARHHKWKGGVHIDRLGYRKIRLDKADPYIGLTNSSGYAPEHRVVMSRALGRMVRPDESVHHIDGNRQNNALSNLELRQGKHGNGIVLRCRSCGSHDVEAVRLTAQGDKTWPDCALRSIRPPKWR